MKPIEIGLDANGKPVLITPQMRQSTHMHVIGGSGKGKSKFLDWMIRKDIREGHGLCLIDWHGTLYQDVVRYCAHLDVGLQNDFRSIILLDPSKSEYITGFNPFMKQAPDVSVQVRRQVDATIRPWGITDTNLMPTFERICQLVYTFAVQQREPISNAALLLDKDATELRDYAIKLATDRWSKRELRRLQNIKSFSDWDRTVLSTENRLSRFLGSKTIRRFMGLDFGNIDLLDIMDQQKILLVNLGDSDFLDRQAARVFASLLLLEFFETARKRAQLANEQGKKPVTFNLYLDEFQEYITGDIGPMLDQVRKGGLHMVLAHQHLGHLADNPKLRKSIFTNARMRAVLGGLDYEDAATLANEMFLPDLNTRQIKKAYYHTTHLYDEQTRKTRSHTSGTGKSSSSNFSHGSSSGSSSGSTSATQSGRGHSVGASTSAPGMSRPVTEGWFSESESESNFNSSSFSESYSTSHSEFSSEGRSEGESTFESDGENEMPVWVPIPIQELGSETEWSREEKVSKVAQMLSHQQQRHCFIKLDTELATNAQARSAQPLQIPFVRDYSHSPEDLVEYERAVYDAQGALAGPVVDQVLEEHEIRFLTVAREGVGSLEQDSHRPVIEISQESEELKKISRRRSRSARPSLLAKLRELPKPPDP